MFSSRNIHFAILGIILGATTAYVAAFYQAAAAAPPAEQPAAAASADRADRQGQPGSQGALPANHPEVNDAQMLAALKKAAEDSPTEPKVLSRYANELFQLGRMEESADWYAKVVALTPKDTDVRALYGAVLWRIGRKADAKTQLQTAVTQDPKHVPSLHGLTIIAIDSKDMAMAKQLVQRIEKSDPAYDGLSDLKKKVAAAEAKAGK